MGNHFPSHRRWPRRPECGLRATMSQQQRLSPPPHVAGDRFGTDRVITVLDVRSAAGWCLRCCSSWSHHGKLSTATPQPTYRFGLYGFQSPPIYTRPSPVRHEGGLRVRRWAASEVEDTVDHPRCDRRLGPLRRRSGLARAGGRSQRVPHGRGQTLDGQGSALNAAICCGMSASTPRAAEKRTCREVRVGPRTDVCNSRARRPILTGLRQTLWQGRGGPTGGPTMKKLVLMTALLAAALSAISNSNADAAPVSHRDVDRYPGRPTVLQRSRWRRNAGALWRRCQRVRSREATVRHRPWHHDAAVAAWRRARAAQCGVLHAYAQRSYRRLCGPCSTPLDFQRDGAENRCRVQRRCRFAAGRHDKLQQVHRARRRCIHPIRRSRATSLRGQGAHGRRSGRIDQYDHLPSRKTSRRSCGPPAT